VLHFRSAFIRAVTGTCKVTCLCAQTYIGQIKRNVINWLKEHTKFPDLYHYIKQNFRDVVISMAQKFWFQLKTETPSTSAICLHNGDVVESIRILFE